MMAGWNPITILCPPIIRETLDEMRKKDAFRLATTANGFDDVRGKIGQSEDAHDVGRGQAQLFRKIGQVGRLSHYQHLRPLPGVADGADDGVLPERHAVSLRDDDVAVSADAFQLERHRVLDSAIVQYPLFCRRVIRV